MLQELIFSIDLENRKEEVFFVVRARYKGSAKIVYGSDLQVFAKMEKTLAVLLLQELSLSLGRNNVETVSCEKIYVRKEKSLTILQELIRSKRLDWKGRSLFFNPLGKSTVEITAKRESSGGLLLTGSICIDGDTYGSSEVEFLFRGPPIWGIIRQRVFCLSPKTRHSWIQGFCPSSVLLTGKDKERFEEEALDPSEGFPSVVWEGEERGSPASQEVFPCLVLRDPRGAFADLHMKYGDFSVDFSLPTEEGKRDRSAEKSWEKDLLETGFTRKIVGNSHYYCPMDQVAKTLSFLLELGWDVIDYKGRKLCKLQAVSVLCEEELSKGQNLRVRGILDYGAHKASLADVVGAFVRKEHFLELSPSVVGWLGEEELLADVGDLVDCERVGGACVVSKKQFGLLESFAERSPSIRSLLERLSGAQAVEASSGSSFKGDLFPYQEEGRKWLQFLAKNQFSGLLADEMGLGKTVQVLSFLADIVVDKPILIVVPTSLVFNWQREWEKFIPHKKLYVHTGSARKGKEYLEKQEAILTSYALLRIDQLLFSQIPCSVVVLDEAQWIKNPESQLAQAVFALQAEQRLCLSGTPLENRADDLWSLFHFLESELLGERKAFLATLAASTADDRYKQRIRKKIRPFLLRRRKEEVAKDLPEKLEQLILIEMKEEQRAFYEEWLAKTRKGLLQKIGVEGAKAHRMEILEAILRLRQICVDPSLVDGEWAQGQKEPSAKVERILRDLEEAVGQGRKILVYSQFTTFLHILEKRIRSLGYSYVYLDGETKNREAVVEKFQQDPSVSIFLLSLKAGGVGLNLTAADYVFLCDPWWNESVERQAIDRTHRLGRKETVVARRYVMAESVEEKMLKIKAHKTALAQGLLDGALEDSMSSLEDMIDLLR